MPIDYSVISELAGDDVSQEQVDRSNHRYWWAAAYCAGKDVVEAGCGVGQGVGYLNGVARSFQAGDFAPNVLAYARKHYGARFEFQQFDALQMPFADVSCDVVLIFEAIYYLPDAAQFLKECVRVLRPGGKLLIATANKDLFDFNPSPNSHRYLGVQELNNELGALGFSCVFYGDTPVGRVSSRQRLLRPLKALAAKSGLMPKTNETKKFFKRLMFGKLVAFPAEVFPPEVPWVRPQLLAGNAPDNAHKVLLCAATLDLKPQ